MDVVVVLESTAAADVAAFCLFRAIGLVIFTASLDKYANPVLDLMERNAPRSVDFR